MKLRRAIRRAALALAATGGLGLLAIVLVIATAVALAALTTPRFATVRAAYGSSEGRLLDRHGELLQSVRLDERTRQLDWVPLGSVSPLLPQRLIAVEDRRYAWHPGVDPIAVAAALEGGLAGRGWRGASTLTMQLVAELGGYAGRRTLPGKLRQVVGALGLELRWSKPQILEAYLNRVSFRGETRGIGAAARLLFGKEPSGLDADESLLLVAALAAPGASSDAWAKRACALSAASTARCAALRTLALDAAVPDQPTGLPQLAPHVARRLLARPGETVASTLDAGLQRAVADILRTQLLALEPQQARDGAAVVLDNASGEVLAYVGSAGPASSAALVDGARAPRQAGSTLKPFLYALALERGLLTPASLLEDSPLAVDTAGGLYAPQNYDHAFRGRVSLRTALASSLNVPAVRTLMLIGPDRLHATLQRAGYAHLLPHPEAYGYALALGAADVTLLEQANAYRTLANGGVYTPVRLTTAAAASAPRARVRRARRLAGRRHPRRPRRARPHLRPGERAGHAPLERGEDRHQQEHARQLVHRLVAPLHRGRVGRQLRRRCDARGERRHRRRARLDRDHGAAGERRRARSRQRDARIGQHAAAADRPGRAPHRVQRQRRAAAARVVPRRHGAGAHRRRTGERPPRAHRAAGGRRGARARP